MIAGLDVGKIQLRAGRSLGLIGLEGLETGARAALGLARGDSLKPGKVPDAEGQLLEAAFVKFAQSPAPAFTCSVSHPKVVSE